ncbi:hypothetical protein DTO271G3_7088 [Paecilomyces variotii]|nr:hypothetical protein DTO271G3_7088 [Paecilomyces variotii]
MPSNALANTPSRRGPPLGSSPNAPIVVPSEASSDSGDVGELLRQLRELLHEFRRVVVSLEVYSSRGPSSLVLT